MVARDYYHNAHLAAPAPLSVAPQPVLVTLNNEEGWTAQSRLLIADGDPEMRAAYANVLATEDYVVTCVASADEARPLLAAGQIDLMLCDMHLSDKNGLDFLLEVQHLCPNLPVILTSIHGTVDMARAALERGASDFVVNPWREVDLPILIERNLTRQAVQRRNTVRWRTAVQSSNESVLDALLTALNVRDTEPLGHAERVTAYTMELAEVLRLSDDERYHIERGALLHDIGKMGVPDAILLKPGKLTDEEWFEIRKHPVIGHQMCGRISTLHQIALIVRHHHEAWDGTGYPDGISGSAIPLGARLFALSDALDAITSDRPYRVAQSFSVARDEIARCSGSQFDPELVHAFLAVPVARWQQIRTLTTE